MRSWYWAALAAVVAGACGVDHRVKAPSHEEAAPRPLTAAAPGVASDRAVAGEPKTIEPAPLDLEGFAPLLSEPQLAAAARAVEEDAPEKAVRAVEAALVTDPPPREDVPRWQYLLGRLREQAEMPREAAASYELAAAWQWPLSGYARLGAGRTLLRAGLFREALEQLKAVPRDEIIARDADLLIAEAALALSDTEQAIETWRRYLKAHEHPPDWTTVSLRLAEALIEGHEAPRDAPGAADERAESRPAPTRAKERVAERKPADADVQQDAIEALSLAREVIARAAADEAIVERAGALEARALRLLPEADRAKHAAPSVADELVRLETLVEARHFSDAQALADSMLAALPRADRYGETGCSLRYYRAKSMAGQREWGAAADYLGDVIRFCQDEDLHARALYLAGKYSDYDKRYSLALKHYARLEHDHPEHRLADDARLRAALSQLRLGAEARFTALLKRMPDDYPNGDMVLDGVFELGFRRIEKGDWSGAASVFDRGAALAAPTDANRPREWAGRERYFFARSLGQIGQQDRMLEEYETIIRTLPLSYYMLHAFARLSSVKPERANSALEAALERSSREPFSFEPRPEFEQPGFVRALELLRQGDVEAGKREITALGLIEPGASPEILWGVALLYARAGAPRLSHAVARGLLTDWLERWPSGDWARAWELAFPRPYHDLVASSARDNGVPESLAFAIMREESAFDSEAVSPANAYGLMQLIEPTARHFAKQIGLPADPKSLTRPSVNIALGCRVLGSLLHRFDDDPLLAIPGYNAGPGRPARWKRERPEADFDVWVEQIPFRETRRYTKRVLASRAAYAFLYGSDEPAQVLSLPLRLE